MKKLLRLLLLLAALPQGTATAAPDILIEGFDGVFWQNINDGDLVADQAVTDFDRVNLGVTRERRSRVRNTNNNDTLPGTGTVAPDIRVRSDNGMAIFFDIDDGDLNPDQDVTDFGRVRLGNGWRKFYRIVNDGTSTLHVASITSSAASFTVTSFSSSIPPLAAILISRSFFSLRSVAPSLPPSPSPSSATTLTLKIPTPSLSPAPAGDRRSFA